MAAMGRDLGFAAAHDAPVPYIDRSRDYYLAMGYPKPYEWAHLAEVPFTVPDKQLGQMKFTVITTAAPVQPGKGAQGAGAAMNPAAALREIYSASSCEPPELGISHLHYDRVHTRAADQGAFTPLAALADAAASGRIGAVTPRFHSVPTRYSHRLSLKKDAPELLARLREDQTDVALLAAI
jgi:hypothetical protein